MIRRLVLALATAALFACGSSADLSEGTFAASVNAGGNKFLTAMTRNLYVGGDLFLPFVSPDPFLAASTVWGDILASDPASCMAAIADELRTVRPDLVGLQEVSHIIVTPLGQSSPVLLELDYLQLLLSALSGPLDPPLRVVAVQPETDITIPFLDQGVQVRLIDRDVILVDRDVTVTSSSGGNYATNFVTTLGGVLPVTQQRGWVAVSARHQGVPFTFVNTHLEVKELGPIQSFQAAELLGLFGATAPTILLGDFNSDPSDPPHDVPLLGSIPTPYQILSAAFTDAASTVGDTCCYATDLRPPSSLFERVDLVLVRGAVTPSSALRVGTTPLEALGNRWPSDHAGVVATLRLQNARFLQAAGR